MKKHNTLPGQGRLWVTLALLTLLGGASWLQQQAAKLRADMEGYEGAFLRPYVLDFFYLLQRPQPLANALVVTAPPTPSLPPAPPSRTAGLAGSWSMSGKCP